MEELIYYPAFEPKSIDWLKFALLYIDRLDPIVPTSGDKYLSELCWKLREETDLLCSHRPTEIEGLKASKDAVDIGEGILKAPEDYQDVFFVTNFVNKWKSKKNQKYTLFEEKYSGPWERFCLKNKLGHRVHEGLAVAKDLGFIYMTVLAQAIGDLRGMSSVTDYGELDKLAIIARKPKDRFGGKIRIAQSIVQLQLPADLSELKLDRIIQYRNKAGFKDRLHAFHESLENYIIAVESGRAEKDFVLSQGSILRDFSDEIVSIGARGANFALGVWILMKTLPLDHIKYLKEIVTGTAFSIGSIIEIRNRWKNTRTRRYTRRYLADVSRVVA